MEIAKWMKHPVHSVKPLDSIGHAREIMEKHRINQLPVVASGKLVGIVTDRDLRDAFPSVFATARRPDAASDPTKITVETVMTPNVLTLGPADSVQTAAAIMRRERIGAVPVVEHGKLVGILARSDVLDAFTALADVPEAPEPTHRPR